MIELPSRPTESGQAVRHHRAFRALLLALSYPGRRYPLPVRSVGSGSPRRVLAPQEAGARLIFYAVWEPDTAVHVVGQPSVLPPIRQVGAAATRLMLVFARQSGGLLLQLPRGNEECPEAGATVLYAAPGPTRSTLVRLSGPGVRGSLETYLPLPAVELADRNAACQDWPLGIDLIVVDADGMVVALPRTTRLELLD
ncbi:MAG: phosphonate C-P lyase system protein PhnH [Chloroflexi bacterium]|nr:phosphonate C-P lyase system protein PhnH [Chloroflexota bacterium]